MDKSNNDLTKNVRTRISFIRKRGITEEKFTGTTFCFGTATLYETPNQDLPSAKYLHCHDGHFST